MFYSNYSAISHGNPVFQQMTLIWPFKVTKGQTDYTIWFAPYHFLYTFYSNYSAISHGNPVFQQMTLIWPFKVTKGQTVYTIWFAPYHFIYMFYSNYSAVSHGNPVFSRWPRSILWLLSVTKGRTNYSPASGRKCLEFPNFARAYKLCLAVLLLYWYDTIDIRYIIRSIRMNNHAVKSSDIVIF